MHVPDDEHAVFDLVSREDAMDGVRHQGATWRECLVGYRGDVRGEGRGEEGGGGEGEGEAEGAEALEEERGGAGVGILFGKGWESGRKGINHLRKGRD